MNYKVYYKKDGGLQWDYCKNVVVSVERGVLILKDVNCNHIEAIYNSHIWENVLQL